MPEKLNKIKPKNECITMTTNSYGGITRIRFIGYNLSRTLAAPLCVLLPQR